jgi:hypothetical protein
MPRFMARKSLMASALAINSSTWAFDKAGVSGHLRPDVCLRQHSKPIQSAVFKMHGCGACSTAERDRKVRSVHGGWSNYFSAISSSALLEHFTRFLFQLQPAIRWYPCPGSHDLRPPTWSRSCPWTCPNPSNIELCTTFLFALR